MQAFVRLKNNGSEVVALPYRDATQGNREEIISFDPGEEKVVPWDVMILFCGDPSVTNKEYWRERDEAINSLHLCYGALSLAGPDSGKMPNLEARSMDGEIIPTLLADPLGDHLVPTAGDTTDVGRLQAQIEALQAEVRNIADAPEAPDVENETVNVDDIPVDKPSRAKVTR